MNTGVRKSSSSYLGGTNENLNNALFLNKRSKDLRTNLFKVFTQIDINSRVSDSVPVK